MVAVVSGSGLGLFGSSVSGLGGAGAAGGAALGRGGDRAYVNTATGNLIVQSQDEVQSALGLDLALIRTYNSQGLLDDDNGDNWRLGVHQRVFMLAGTPNAAGSTIAKVFGDGREVLYTYDSSRSVYVSTEGDGAHDTLSYNTSTAQWTWTDGSARNNETYDSDGQLLASTDADGNTVSYIYTGSLLTLVTDASGQSTYLDYNGNDLTQIRVVSNGQTQTLTRYSYDTAHRLTQVQIDLSPPDNSIADNQTYITTYTYDGASRRIASIVQSDGSSVAFTYELIDGDYRVKTYTDGEARVTTLTYTQATAGGSTPVQAPANGGVLSTTDTQSTTTEHALDSGAVSTTDTQTTTSTYNLDTAALGGIANSSPVVQTYHDDANRVIGTLHADGSLTSYEYRGSQLVSAHRHVSAPLAPLWSQDFSQDASGFVPMWPGFNTHENGALTLSTQSGVEAGWRMSFGERSHDFSDHVVYRGEVTTGNSSEGRAFNFGTENLEQSRRHSAIFVGDSLAVSYNDGGWQEAYLGTVKSDATYVVEVATHAQGSTLYVFEKGTDRESGFIHQLSFTDWGTSRSFFETFGHEEAVPASVRLDNVSEATVSGALIGSWIAAESAQDTRIYYDDAGRVSGTFQNGILTSYNYDALGQLVSLRRHDSAPILPVWSQDFSKDASGLSPLHAAFNTHENGALTVSTGDDAAAAWRITFGEIMHDFADHPVFRAEVGTGSAAAPRNFNIGAVNETSTRAHSAVFRAGSVLVGYYDQGWQELTLGSIENDTTYVVEVATDVQGTTLYVYEKGTDRANGYVHQLSFTDWELARPFFETYAAPSYGESSVRLDNISVASAPGALIGSWIAVESAQDVIGPAAAYTVPAGATWQSVASTLYGVDSAEAGAALQAALGNPPLTAGSQLTGLPSTLNVTTTATVTVPAYYTIPSGATWQSIANALYGINSVAAGLALQTVLGDPPLTAGNRLTDLPATLSVTTTTTVTVPAYYTVQTNDTWASITQTIYGTSDPDAIAALQNALGNPALTAGLHLTVPLTLTYGGTGTLYQHTDVQDALGLVTTYINDSSGRLTAMLSPAVNGSRLETRYAYDADGNLTSITQDPSGLNRVTTLSYDADGNLLSTRDSAGNTVTRTYNASNQLLTETQYLVRDPDGAGAGQPSAPLTARYVYDGENHLRFVISAQGRVTEHRYSGAGLRQTSFTYAGGLYSAASFAETDLAAWAGAQNLTQLERLDYAYDFRGNLASRTAYAATNASGAGTGSPSITRFIYDQRGQLLQTIDARGTANTPDPNTANLPYATTYTYDGLGRVLSTTQWNSNTSLATTLSVAYDDANRRTTLTLANGLVTTQTYNLAGELISVANGTAAVPAGLGTTTYAYDADGRLRIVTDPSSGVRAFHLYDDAGRKIGFVDGDGTLSEFVYDRANQLIKTIQYAALLDGPTLASLADTNGNPVAVPFAQLRTAASSNAAHDRIARNVYDAAGQLIYAIDEVGAVTKLVRDGVGRVTEEVRYANPVTIARTADQVLEGDLTIVETADDRHVRHFYNGDGNLAGTLDAAGYLVEYRYDAAGHLVQQIGYATQTSGTGTLDQLRPALDNETALTPEQDIVSYFFYDGQGRRIAALDAEGYLTETVYDAAGQVTQSIRYDRALTYTAGTSTFQTLKAAATVAPAPITHTQSYQYDDLGRVIEETDYEGTITRYDYDEVGNLISSTRAAGTTQARSLEKRYDLLGRLTQELTAEGRALITGGMSQEDIDDIWTSYGVSYAYDAAGRRISATVRPSATQTNKTLYFYDNDSRLRFEVNALGEVKENRYNALGQLTDSIAYTNSISTAGLTGGLVNIALTDRVTAAANSATDAHTVLTYTTRGQVESMTTAESASTSYTYNAFGEESASVQALDGATSLEHAYSYDKRGLLTTTHWDPNAIDTTELRQYDAFGRVAQMTDPNGNSRRFEYDRLGRTIVTVDALNAERTTAYDAFSRTLTTSDALGHVTQYQYDDVARSIVMTTPEGIVVTTRHDRHGQTLSVEAGGLTTEYSYDANGQLTSVTDDLGTLESRTYDRAGRQLMTTDARGATTQFEYDAASRVLTRTVDTAGLALTTTYTYDGQGRVRTVTDPNDVTTRTSYDRDGRIVEVTVDPDDLNIRTTYDYDLGGRLIRVTEGTGTVEYRVTEYIYDALGRRTTEIVDPDGLELTTTYSYDSNGNLAMKVDAAGNQTIYVYDAENRQRFVIDAMDGINETSYDANGRVTAATRFGGTFDAELPVDGLVSLQYVSQAPRFYATQPPIDRMESYVYDDDGRQVFTIDALGGVTRKEYDDRGNVIRQVMYSQQIAATNYDTVQQVEAALDAVDDDDVTNDRESRAVYDLRGRARYAIDGLGGVVAYHYDAVGNVVARTEYATPFTGSITTLTELDAWATGAAVPQDRTTRTWYDAANRVRFTLDAENYLHEKRYDSVGRVTAEILYDEQLSSPVANNATTQDIEAVALSIADPAHDQRTDTTFDAAGRATQVADATEAFDAYTYDAVGNRRTFTNKSGATWTYVYDANRRLIEEHTPQVDITTVNYVGGGPGGYGGYNTDLASSTATDSLITRMAYDALGNVISRTEAYGRSNERTTSYSYDALGRQISVEFPPVADASGFSSVQGYGPLYREEFELVFGHSTTTAYDALGNAIHNEDVGGGGTQRIYDALGRVRYVIDAERYVTEYRYDTFGNQVELIRYSHQFDPDQNEYGYHQPIDPQAVPQLLQVDPATDRVIQTQYDRLNRAVRVTQPETLAFLPNVGQPGGQLISASPTTVNEYDAQGQLRRQSQLVDPLAGVWASTYFYYDERGQMVAQVDALGYVTTYEYDAAGNRIRTVEYARALAAGSWNADGYGAPPITTLATSPDDPAGYDRVTECVYDQLNRKIAERRVGLVTSQTPQGADQVTTFGYDALGNQTRVTDANGASTFVYYDVLGRQIAIATPARDSGDGTFLTPLTRMRRDAFGNLVEQIVYARGATAASESAFSVTADVADQRTRLLVDAMNRVLQTMDASGAKRFASYNGRGDLAVEWQPIPNSNSAATLHVMTTYEYDRLGRQTTIHEPMVRPSDGFFIEDNQTHIDYNAFGEMVARRIHISESDTPSESFEYDQAGRLWRTNTGDGVWKVYLYDLAGRATAEIRSQQLDLSSVTGAQGAADLTSQRMRTETRYDLLGRVLEQRLPGFTPANPDSELEVIGAQFRVDNDVLGPSNPDAAYRLIAEEINFGYESFAYTLPVLDPAASAAQGGGYQFVAPTAAHPNGGWVQDTSYHLASGRYLHWARPADYALGYGFQSMNIAFEYRAHGDNNGAWTTLRVVPLPNGEVGVDLGSLSNGEFDYRVTYTRANQLSAYAIATGTITVAGTNATTADTTLATLAAQNITPTSISTQVPLNSQFRDAYFRIGGFSGMNPLDGFVYRRVVSGSLVSYVVDRQATVAQGGGYYLTASGYVQDPNYTVIDSLSIRWNAPADSSLFATFEYWSVAASAWNELPADLTGAEYSVAIGELADGPYEYRISYRSNANPTAPPVATATGIFRIEPANAADSFELAPDPSDNGGTVAPVSNRPAGSNDVETQIISSSGQSNIGSAGIEFTGTNDVLVTFPSFSGAVRVELEYLTRPIAPEDDPGPSGSGWPAETRRISLLLNDAAAAANGLHLIWNDPAAPSTGGGISEITRVRVYSVANDGQATLRSASADADAAMIGGTALSWDAPWNTGIVATFQARPAGTTTWQPLTVIRSGQDFSVDVQSLGAGAWEYEITYTQNGVTRAVTQGTFVASGGGIANVFEDPGSSPFPVEAVAPVSGIATSPVEFTVVNSAEQIVTGPSYILVDGQMREHHPLTTSWDQQNEIALTWANLGADPVRVVVDYTSAPRYSYNYTNSNPPHWEESAVYVPGVRTSRTLEFSSAATGATLTWSDADGDVGGVETVHRVRVYTQVAGQWVLKYDRDAAAPAGGASLYWPAPDNEAVDSAFKVRQAGSSTWQTISVSTSTDGLKFVDLNGLAAGSYEYEISHSITEGSTTTVVALTTGEFTVPAAQAGAPQTRSLGVTQHNAAFDRGANDFGPVSWDGEQIAWNLAPQAGDTILVRTRVVGSTTWQEQTITGSGPDYVAAVTAAANQALEFEILYTHTGETTAYSASRGTLNSTVSAARRPAAISVTQVTVVQTTIDPVEDVANTLGVLTWTTQPFSSADVSFRYQLQDGTWQALTPQENFPGYRVDHSALPTGVYRYEIIYKRASDSLPYAFASGVMTIGGSPDGGGLSILDTTSYSQIVTQSTNPGVPTRLQSVDRWGNVLSTTDALGNVTHYRYDQSGHVIRSEQPSVAVVDTSGGAPVTGTLPPVTENLYDLSGRLIATRDANGNLNSVGYNAAGQVISETHADGGVKHFVYDAFGNQVLVTDELGFRTRNTYDEVNRLVQVRRELEVGSLDSPQGAIDRSYEYDEVGRRIREFDGLNWTNYEYDLAGNVTARITPRGFRTTYDYDLNGKKIRERDANGLDASWSYEFGRLLSHTDIGGTVTKYEYDAAGLLVRQTNSLGQNLTYQYDAAGQLIRIIDKGVSDVRADVVSSNRLTEYGYDLAGRRTVERTLVDNRVQQNSRISYDVLGRMTQVQDPDFIVNYSYDAAGNRTHISSTYFNHEGYAPGNQQPQDLWYTYDEMNRVLITQGVYSNGIIDVGASQGAELGYNLRGERISARTAGEHLVLDEVFDGEFGFVSQYSKQDGIFTERYGYDGAGRLTWTEQDVPTTSIDLITGLPTTSITSVRTTTRQYDAASRETLNQTFAIDGNGPATFLSLTARSTSYDLDGRMSLQETTKNGVMQFRVLYGTAQYVAEQVVPITSPAVTSYRTLHSAGLSNGLRRFARTLARRVILTWLSRNSGLPEGYVRIPGHWVGTGFDEAGVLHGYKVEVYRPGDGKYLYATEHKLDYRLAEGYQLIREQAHSFTTVHNVGLPGDGSTTRTYNVNGELVQYSDSKDANKNRYLANDAQGQALTVIQGNFDGKNGHLNANQAFDNALARTGNQVKAQYFFSANGQTVGSFGQLTDEDGEFKANFDVNYTPVSEQYPASVPSQVIVQRGDTLRLIAARVFGDASLWYVIAQENGLTDPDAALQEGTLLRIPNEVVSPSNSAWSFKPFDVSDAIGDATPTQPAPKQKKKHGGLRGFLETLVVIVIAIVVTIYLGPIIGNAAGQGAAIALGIQDEFNWKSLGVTAVTAGVTQGIGVDGLSVVGQNANSVVNQAINGVISNAIGQGVNIAVGLQDDFSWRDLAVSAISAPVAKRVRNAAGNWVDPQFDTQGYTNTFASNFVSGVAAGTSSVAVRMALGGKVDTQAVVADVFGNALGNSIVEGMAPPSVAQARGGSADELQEVQITPRYIGPDAERANARLDNNPANPIYQPGASRTPDEVRAADAIDSSPTGIIETVVSTAPYWRVGEENHYWTQQFTYHNAFGQFLSEDDATRGATELYQQDVRDQVAAIQRQNTAMLVNDFTPVGAGVGLYNLGIKTIGGAASTLPLLFGRMDTARAWQDSVNQAQVHLPSGVGELVRPGVNQLHSWSESHLGDGATTLLGAGLELTGDLLVMAPGARALRSASADIGLLNRPLQSPIYLDLQQGAVAYSGVPIGMRSLLKPTELAPIYEQQIRELYGTAGLGQRQFKILGDDGRLALRTADNVAIIGGEKVAIEAKYISDFSISPYNPNSFAGGFKNPTTGLTEFQRTVNQATTYSNNFNSVIYHSTSQEFINFYRPIFEQQGLNNMRFVLTPIKPL